MKAAAGLADAIADTFGVRPQMIEAHNGVFEVLLNGEMIYTNQSACSRVPTVPEALEVLARHIEPLPGKTHRAKNPFPLM